MNENLISKDDYIQKLRNILYKLETSDLYS